MEEIDSERIEDLDEAPVDVLKGLIVRLEGVHKLRRTVEEPFRQNNRAN